MSEPDDPVLRTVEEVRGVLRVSKSTMVRLLDSGEIPSLQIGRSRRIRQDVLDRYLAGRPDPEDAA